MILSYRSYDIQYHARTQNHVTVYGKRFRFLPGESVILPEGVSMNVGFPDADEDYPVQCATIALDWDIVNKNLEFLQEHYSNMVSTFE